MDIISNTTMMYKLSLHRRRRTKEKDWHRRIKSSVLKYYLPSSNLLLLSLFFLTDSQFVKRANPSLHPLVAQTRHRFPYSTGQSHRRKSSFSFFRFPFLTAQFNPSTKFLFFLLSIIFLGSPPLQKPDFDMLSRVACCKTCMSALTLSLIGFLLFSIGSFHLH